MENEEEKKADESTKQKSDESGERKPSEYEIILRKENEKLRKDLEAKIKVEQEEKEKILKEQGEFRKLYEEAKPKLDEYESLKVKLESIENETRKELIERFPEEKREAVKDLPLEKLKELVKFENLDDKKNSSFSGRGGGKGNIITDGKQWDDFTTEQRKIIKEKNKSEYDRMYKKKFGFTPK